MPGPPTALSALPAPNSPDPVLFARPPNPLSATPAHVLPLPQPSFSSVPSPAGPPPPPATFPPLNGLSAAPLPLHLRPHPPLSPSSSPPVLHRPTSNSPGRSSRYPSSTAPLSLGRVRAWGARGRRRCCPCAPCPYPRRIGTGEHVGESERRQMRAAIRATLKAQSFDYAGLVKIAAALEEERGYRESESRLGYRKWGLRVGAMVGDKAKGRGRVEKIEEGDRRRRRRRWMARGWERRGCRWGRTGGWRRSVAC